jgi:hypothetical protein
MNQEKLFTDPGRIPVPIPWTRAEWGQMTIEAFQKDPKFEQLMAAWDRHSLGTAEKKTLYYKILYVSLKVRANTAAELVSRPDFESLATPKSDERWSKENLWQLLDTAADIVTSGPQFFPGPSEAFEFLAVALDFSSRLCERAPHYKDQKLTEAMERVMAYALPFLFAAINESLSGKQN